MALFDVTHGSDQRRERSASQVNAGFPSRRLPVRCERMCVFDATGGVSLNVVFALSTMHNIGQGRFQHFNLGAVHLNHCFHRDHQFRV